MLDNADSAADLPPRLRGLVASQRGLLCMRAGRFPEALTGFDAAVRLLDESVPEDVCRAFLNRGLVYLQQGGALAKARADFERCADVAHRYGLSIFAAKAMYNLGFLSFLQGDLPRALREMDVVAPILAGQSAAFAGVCHMDQARVLLAAGLPREADEALAQAADLFRAARVPQDQAEAELTRAQIALAEQRWADAGRLARLSRRRFEVRGATTWSLLAESVLIAAAAGSGRTPRATADRALRLSLALAVAGLDEEARRAALTAAAAKLARRDAAGARAAAGDAIVLRRDDSIASRLHAREVRFALADANGEHQRAETELRGAFADLHRYQASFGSLDLQTAVSGQGYRIAAIGLRRALATGRPATIFGWAERGRALSSRLPSIVPPADSDAAQLVEDLRGARVRLREQTLNGHVDPRLRVRCASLERMIRRQSWHLGGPRRTTAPATLLHLREKLAPAGTYVAFLLSDSHLHALVVGPDRQALRDLGPAAGAIELRSRLRADLDVLATVNLLPAMRASVRASCDAGLRAIDELLLHPVRGHLADGPILLAPPAVLTSVPWTLLPTLRGRPVTVTASATAWLIARAAKPLPDKPTVTLAAGPRLPYAPDEIATIAEHWPAATTLHGEATTAAAVRDAAGATDVLHIAAHGTHEPDNPLFSYLELADGPLFGHELGRLPQLPAHVVLSACELGRARSRLGDETLGMTVALLHGGTGSVVSGVARLPDAAVCRAAAAHHVGLRAGLSPSAALAAATDEVPVPLVCFGAGW